MNAQYSITTTPAGLAVRAPFNPHFNSAARDNLGGRWDATEKAWVFDARNEDTVRDQVCRSYGDVDGEPLVSLRIRFDSGDGNLCGPVMRAGRIVASASGRDSGARLGNGVIREAGSVTSGGSVKNWRTIVNDGCVVVVHDVPRRAAQYLLGEGAYEGERYEILEPTIPAAIDRNALEQERVRLTARIAEIYALLEAT